MTKPLAITGAVVLIAVFLAPDIVVPFLVTLLIAVSGAAIFITILGALYAALVALGTAMFFWDHRKAGR